MIGRDLAHLGFVGAHSMIDGPAEPKAAGDSNRDVRSFYCRRADRRDDRPPTLARAKDAPGVIALRASSVGNG